MALQKLGNPVILESKVVAPQNLLEVQILGWPVAWGYLMLGLLGAGTLLVFLVAGRSFPTAPSVAGAARYWLWLPLAWGLWQGLSAMQAENALLARTALWHFSACVAAFYFGWRVLGRAGELRWFWVLLLVSFGVALLAGLDQHFGGLEETRRRFLELPPETRAQFDSPEFRARMASNRIFSTFVYPNVFAGAILLLLPLAVKAFWELGRHPRLSGTGRLAPWTMAGLPALAGGACLYWSGSKAGWLIALVMLSVAFWRAPIRHTYKWLAVALVAVAGLTGFFLKNAGYFQRGATSATARMDYWRAAATVAREHPLLGGGPGNFFVFYRRLKPPEAEMARMAHNDYLQQACDSGLPGGLLYAAFIGGSLVFLGRSATRHPLAGAVWLGLLGWSLQGFVEFGLYIPALAWPAFLLFGWSWAKAGESQAG